MTLKRSKTYLQNVILKKDAIPFRRFSGGVGRKAMAKNYAGTTQVRFPRKSAEFLLSLLKNAEANAEQNGLDLDLLTVEHIQVQQAPKRRRRTYRAHGRINPYMSSPCHIEVILVEKEDAAVPKPKEVAADDKAGKKKVSQKKLARERARGARE